MSMPNQMPNKSVPMSMKKCAILLVLWPALVLASESCLYCRGINCQRSSYQATEQCVNQLDACISVFQGGMIQAQGCLQKLEDSWRQQCDNNHYSRAQCEICVTDSCNNVAASQLSCLQCLDSEDERCRTAPEQLSPQTCAISHSGRNLCYASIKDQRIERGCSLTLSEQQSCLADANCQLCDPSEIQNCNNQLLEEIIVTTEPPIVSTTSSSTSSSTTSSTSTSTPSSTSTTTEEPPTNPTTQKPNSAHSISVENVLVFLAVSQLVYIVIFQ